MNDTKKDNILSSIFCAILFILSVIPFICIGISLYTLLLYNKIALFILSYVFFVIFMILMLLSMSLYNYLDLEKKTEEKIKFLDVFKKSFKDVTNLVLIGILFVVITIVLIIFTRFYY